MREVRLAIPDEILDKIPEELRKDLVEQIEKSELENRKKLQIYKEAMQLHDSGLGKRRISKILNYPTSTVDSWLHAGSKPNPKTNVSTTTVLDLKQIGLTNKEIGRLLSIHPFTVLQRMRSRKSDNKIFRISEKVETFIKTEKTPINFIKSFSLNCSKKEIESFERFCNFVKLKDKLSPRELARKIGKSYIVTYNWKKGKDAPRLVRWLKLLLCIGKPERGFVWLPLNLGSSGIPKAPVIQVPKRVKSWVDVEKVILQLKSNGTMLPEMGKDECFGFILGMIVGDTSKPTANRDSIALKLSKVYDTNKKLGDFFCKCIQKLGLNAHEIKDDVNKYRWSSQSSLLLSWIYTIALGLEKRETTTYNPINVNWLLDSPKNVQKRFLQGIFESDGSVSYGDTVDCSVYPNSELIKTLLSQFGIKSYIILDRKWKKLIINNSDNSKCHDILFAPEIKTERYKRLERLVNAKRLKKGEKLPVEVRNVIEEAIKSGAKNYEIIKQVLIKTGYFISPFRIKYHKKIV